ncbi:MAG: VTC domain-containing protein [Spirochaetes bacterium]|nr:VTC domain-containing protein [Spirochaetota bacterium]
MRYERKIPLGSYKIRDIQGLIKYNSARFCEIFHQRRVNSIYFDDMERSCYISNLNGEDIRFKYRLRWYGEMYGLIKPVFEIKVKNGLSGDKRTYELDSFYLEEDSNGSKILNQINFDKLPRDVFCKIQLMRPVLMVTYLRRYYISYDKKFRLTTDSEIRHAKIPHIVSKLKFNLESDDLIEIKYEIKNDNLADKIINEFPFRVDKNSKYANGIAQVL